MSSTGNWVTINGVHVLIGATGKVEKGPKNLIGKTYDKALSTASGNSVSDPFTDTRTSNTVDVGNYSSLSSARADMKSTKKKAKELEKEERRLERLYRTNTVVSEKQAKGIETTLYKTRKIGEYQRRFNSATTPEAKEAIIKEAKGKGYYLSKNGYFSTQKPTPASINITMRGVKIDLSTASGRKDAKLLYGGLSEDSKTRFQEFCIRKGLDPVTFKPIQ